MNLFINYFADQASVKIESAIENDSSELLAKLSFIYEKGDERMEKVCHSFFRRTNFL